VEAGKLFPEVRPELARANQFATWRSAKYPPFETREEWGNHAAGQDRAHLEQPGNVYGDE
jgi:hypothetical protein